jgi:N-acetylneuraminic acid mutarotase
LGCGELKKRGASMRITQWMFVACAVLTGCQCGQGEKPPSEDKTTISIAAGAKNPADSTEPAGVSNLPLLQLSANIASDSRELLQSLSIAVSGNAEVLESAALYLDSSADGAVGPEDALLKEVAGPFESGSVAFSELVASLPPGDTALLVVGKLKLEAPSGKSVIAALTNAQNLVGATSAGAPVGFRVTGAPISGGRKTVGAVGTLLVAPGAQTPAASSIAPSSANVAMLQFELSMPTASAEAAKVTAITLAAAGTANDQTAVQRVRLYRDLNANGAIDPQQDLLLGSVDSVPSDNAQVTIVGLAESIPPGTSASMLVVVDFSGQGSTGQTVGFGVAANGVTAVGLRSTAAIATAGTPIAGALKTLDSGGGLFVAAGLMNPAFSTEAVGALNVPMLQMSLKAAANQPIKLTQLTLRASGFGDDQAAYASVRLYLDLNADGVVQTSDQALGTPTTVSGNDGTATFGGLTAVIPAGTTQTILVVADFTSSVLPTESYALGFPANDNLRAVDPSTNAPLSVSGAPVFGGLKTISSQGSVAIALGINAPGPSNESASASNVPVLQFSLTASSVEAVKVTSVTLRANGTVDDSVAIAAVHLYRDVNENGLVDAPGDTAVGLPQSYSADNGTVIFNNLSTVVPASGRVSFIVTCDLSGSAQPGQTFGTSIALSSAVAVKGVSSAATIIPSGTAAGALKTIQALGSLTIAAGINSPGPSQQNPGSAVNMLQFSLTASSVEALSVGSITVRASGSGNDLTAVTGVTLYRDSNFDGLLDSADALLSGPQQYSADNGTVVFGSLGELIPAGQRLHYLVIENLSSSALPGQTFSASLTTGMAVAATGVSSTSAIAPSGSAAGSVITIQGAGLTLAADAQNPVASSEFSNAQKLPMLQVKLTGSASEAVRVTRLIVTAGGTANDAADITAARLYRDVDGSGTVTSGDVQLGATGAFSLDNGTLAFNSLSETISAGATVTLLLAYDLAGTALSGQTFDLRLASNASVTAEGVTSAAPATVGGAPVQGGSKSIKGASLTLATGLANPGATSELPTDADVPMLQLKLSASAADAVRVTAVTLNVAGSLDDSTGISQVRIYRDVDANGAVTGTDVLIAGPSSYAVDNGNLTFSGLNQVIAAGSSVHWLIRYSLSGSGVAGQSFDARIVSNAAVVAESQTTAQAAAVSGAPFTSATKTIRSTAVSVALGANSPGNTSETPNASGVAMLQLRITGDATDPAVLTGLTVTAAGSINDLTDVAEARLYLDNDSDGQVSAGDVLLGSPKQFSGDNGTAFFSGLGQSLGAGAVIHLLVVYDLSGTAAAGGSFDARLASAAGIQAISQASGQAVAVSGAPVIGNAKTIATQFNSWTSISRTAAPRARANHTAVSDGTRMIVFGGEDQTGELGDGAIYTPSTNSWVALPTLNAPSPRTGHVAAVAGGYMVVFGGRKLGLPVTGGARFNLSTNQWQPMSATNAPSARANATIVSTGSTVIIWGGFDGTNLNTGAIYDPAADGWTTMAVAAAPGGRFLHTAVWTGSQMVIWGGYNGAYLSDGGRYTPATNLWTSVASPLAAGMTVAASHTAVWSGSEMLVWGGFRGTSYLNNGAAYNPSTDVWRTLALFGAPSTRAQQVAVFTGSRMVIWGGYSGSVPLDTGGQIDPVFNQWTSTALAGAPVPRFGHTGLWLGSKLIVWGGQTATSYLDSGGKYTP